MFTNNKVGYALGMITFSCILQRTNSGSTYDH